MEQSGTPHAGATGEMRKRRVTLADGRYLIFYTFGGAEAGAAGAPPRAEPEAEPAAGEGRRV